MSKAMTISALEKLLTYIYENNSPFTHKPNKPCVKYVDPVIDMRTGECFSITLRIFSGGVNTMINFDTGYDWKANPNNLYQRVMVYLNTGEMT
jgi:hypothetical protein